MEFVLDTPVKLRYTQDTKNIFLFEKVWSQLRHGRVSCEDLSIASEEVRDHYDPRRMSMVPGGESGLRPILQKGG